MKIIAWLSSMLAAFDPAPRPPNPEFLPVILVHGIHSTSSDMTRMARYFRAEGREVFTPDLSPNDGQATIEELGRQLSDFAEARVDRERKFDLIGFSMGGLVSRYYVQRLGGDERVSHLVTIAAPHHGTMLARLHPGAGSAEMRRGSDFLRGLAVDDAKLARVRFTTFHTPLDLVIVPASSSMMPQARNVRLWASMHPSLILEKRCIRAVAEVLHAREK